MLHVNVGVCGVSCVCAGRAVCLMCACAVGVVCVVRLSVRLMYVGMHACMYVCMYWENMEGEICFIMVYLCTCV